MAIRGVCPVRFRGFLLLLLFLCLFRSLPAAIKVSGTVTGPDGKAAPGIPIYINWNDGYASLTTDSSGGYSCATSNRPGNVNFAVRPPASLRLAQRNISISDVQADLVQDFQLVEGRLLSGRIQLSAQVKAQWAQLKLLRLLQDVPWNEWFGDTIHLASGQFEVVVPPDVYDLWPVVANWEWSLPRTVVDLRSQDVTGLVIEGIPGGRHPFDYPPPDIRKITVGEPDKDGSREIIGTAGAVLPLCRVLVVNLPTMVQGQEVSKADGSFSVRVFAPAGSTLLIKHGPAGPRWDGIANGAGQGPPAFPGTVINVPTTTTAPAPAKAFAALGVLEFFTDHSQATRNTSGNVWGLEGTVGPVAVDGKWTRVLSGKLEGVLKPGLYRGGLSYARPAFADVDGDGDLDLAAGGFYSGIGLYRNLGSAKQPAWEFDLKGLGGPAYRVFTSPALGDLNGDGLIDLAVATEFMEVSIYLNRGTRQAPSWPEKPDAGLPSGYMAAPTLGDLDGDGDLDVVVGQYGRSLQFFRNDSSKDGLRFTLVTWNYAGVNEPNMDYLAPCLADLDGDGDLDLLLGAGNHVSLIRNTGSRTSPQWTPVDPNFLGWGGAMPCPAAGDWDSDGDVDLVVGDMNGNLRFFRQDGPNKWTEEQRSFPFDFSSDSAPALADWDGDGDNDLLVGHAGGSVLRFVNAGSATEPDWRPAGVLLTLPGDSPSHVFPTFADIDGDGDFDLFLGEGNWADTGAAGRIRFFRNVGTRSVPDWQLVTENYQDLDVGAWSRPAFVDIDNDGDLDLFVGDATGTLTFVENIGTRQMPAWATPVTQYAGIDVGDQSSPAFLDVDQDGDWDLLIGNQYGSVTYVRNTGTRSAPQWELVAIMHPEIDVIRNAAPAVGDLNGDGRPDLLVGGEGGGLSLYLNGGAAPAPIPPASYSPGDLVEVRGVLRLYNSALGQGIDPGSLRAATQLILLQLFDEKGYNRPVKNYFMSDFFTPSGFPVQSQDRAFYYPFGSDYQASGFRLVKPGIAEAPVSFAVRLPKDLPAGVYRPDFRVNYFWGFQSQPDWTAGYVTCVNLKPGDLLLPPMRVGSPATPRLVWQLLTEDFSLGLRGTGAREDRGHFGLASQIVTQGAPYVIPRIDSRTGAVLEYRLEPYLPTIAWTDRVLPSNPVIPFQLPGGQLKVTVRQPDGSTRTLGPRAFREALFQSRTTQAGEDVNPGTVQLQDVYSLTAGDDSFRFRFSQYGHHVISMTGTVQDIWGNVYEGAGTYDVWVANPLDIDPGVLPATPFAAGDRFNPSVRLSPAVPAEIELTVTLYPDSDPARAVVRKVQGPANNYGEFSPPGDPIVLGQPGEYRVDLVATGYTAGGDLYMGAATWGGVVMTPPGQTQLVAHGRRGVDNLTYIPNHWFVNGRDFTFTAGAVYHTLNPYYNGDVAWTRTKDIAYGGDALIMGASVQDTVGNLEADIRRYSMRFIELTPPGNLEERLQKAEIPLFSWTSTGSPVRLDPDHADVIAYSYRSSQRPGLRVRELVAEEGESGGYWRLDTLYDNQPGVGMKGDLPNDFKFQYVGIVHRNLRTGRNQYLGHGSGWMFIPDDDPVGSRVMPPFAGPGNGGWTTEGGPLLKLKGKDIHIFILPTGTRPGAVLETGETFRFAGHLMPTLDSQVTFALTSPTGARYKGSGKANSIGYYYRPEDDVVVNEPGVWTVDVKVWHDGLCSGGRTMSPFPTGDVLGSQNGRFWFYVVPRTGGRLLISAPATSWLSYPNSPSADQIPPVMVAGQIPSGTEDARVDYTISMPGYILEQGRATLSTSGFSFVFDPVRLARDFPNLDLIGRDHPGLVGLADTFTISVMLTGRRGTQNMFRANTITIQGQEITVSNGPGHVPRGRSGR